MDTTTENMAHLITGMDALGKGRDGKGRELKPIKFIPREVKNKVVTSALPEKLFKDLVEYCEERKLSQSQLIRYLVSRELWG